MRTGRRIEWWDFGAATFLSQPVGLVVGALALPAPGCRRRWRPGWLRAVWRPGLRSRLRRWWRARLDDRTGMRGPPARSPGCFTRGRRVRPTPPGGRKAGSTYPRRWAGSGAGRRPPSPWPGPPPAGERTAVRARRPAGVHPQAVSVVNGEASVTTSISSRESFSKARHMATSSQESRGPCSSPVASSTTV